MARGEQLRMVTLIAAMAMASYLGGRDTDGAGRGYALDPSSPVDTQRLKRDVLDQTNAWMIKPTPASTSTANVDTMPIWRSTMI